MTCVTTASCRRDAQIGGFVSERAQEPASVGPLSSKLEARSSKLGLREVLLEREDEARLDDVRGLGVLDVVGLEVGAGEAELLVRVGGVVGRVVHRTERKQHAVRDADVHA